MAQVIITINRREYSIACENGQEGHIIRLSRMLDEKAEALTSALGHINENHLLAMVGLIIADELNELKKAQTPSQTPQASSCPPNSCDEDMLNLADERISENLNSLSEVIKSIALQIKSV